MAALNFDANNVQPNDGYEPLPAGDYIATITNSEMKLTKNGLGQYLSLEFQVIGGEFINRKLFTNLLLNHPNQQTVDIAQKKLSSICHAVNMLNLKDSIQLHGLPLTIRVKYKEDEKYGPGNDITAFKSAPKSKTPVAQPQAVVYQQPVQQPTFTQQLATQQLSSAPPKNLPWGR